MILRAGAIGAEISVSDGVNLKPLIKSMRDDVERYTRHATIKAHPGYCPPVWPDAPLTYHARRG